MAKPIKTWRRIEISFVRERGPDQYGPVMRHGGEIAKMARDAIRSSVQEHFLAFYLDTKNQLIGLHVVGVGSVDSCSVHPRDVFGPAMAAFATAIVVAHNHPSGDPTPSSADRSLTERLRQAGDLLGIEVLDHVVIGSERYYSFADEGFRPFV